MWPQQQQLGSNYPHYTQIAAVSAHHQRQLPSSCLIGCNLLHGIMRTNNYISAPVTADERQVYWYR
jgi:hypothetical protein